MRARFLSQLVLAAASLVLIAAPAVADDIIIKQAWSRATPKGAQVAAGYLVIENHGDVADKLISAASPAAAKIEIHEMTTLDGIMVMRPIEGGLVIPAGASVTLAPGASHLMFVGIAAPFTEGQRVGAALMFDRAGKIDVGFDVGGVGAKGPRMIMASTQPAAEAPAPALAAEDFFTHICGTRVMANVTVSPQRDGPVDIQVELEDANEQPLAAEALSVTLSSPEMPAGASARAVRLADAKWHVSMPAAAAGTWSLALGIELAANDRIDIAAPVVIAK